MNSRRGREHVARGGSRGSSTIRHHYAVSETERPPLREENNYNFPATTEQPEEPDVVSSKPLSSSFGSSSLMQLPSALFLCPFFAGSLEATHGSTCNRQLTQWVLRNPLSTLEFRTSACN